LLLVDTNVLIDLIVNDSQWGDWAEGQLRMQQRVHELVINPIIYAELAPDHATRERLDAQLEGIGLRFRELPRDALYLAGVAHRHYRQAGGTRESILADFLIGAHAAVLGCGILTRDTRRYRRYFPLVELVSP
jgi:predicted nucleic acid-binding protein